MRISDWSSDVCSSDLEGTPHFRALVWRPLKAGAAPSHPCPHLPERITAWPTMMISTSGSGASDVTRRPSERASHVLAGRVVMGAWPDVALPVPALVAADRKSTRLNSSH